MTDDVDDAAIFVLDPDDKEFVAGIVESRPRTRSAPCVPGGRFEPGNLPRHYLHVDSISPPSHYARELAVLAGISATTFYRWQEEGLVPFFPVRDSVAMWSQHEATEWLGVIGSGVAQRQVSPGPGARASVLGGGQKAINYQNTAAVRSRSLHLPLLRHQGRAGTPGIHH